MHTHTVIRQTGITVTVDTIARMGKTGGIGRLTGRYGSQYLLPEEFDVLQAMGVTIVPLAEIERLEQVELAQRIAEYTATEDTHTTTATDQQPQNALVPQLELFA